MTLVETAQRAIVRQRDPFTVGDVADASGVARKFVVPRAA